MRFILIAASIFLIPFGLAMSPLTPIPGGAFLFAVGLMLLICTSEWARGRIRSLRARVGRFNQGMTWLEDRMGPQIGNALRRTRPDFEDEASGTAA